MKFLAALMLSTSALGALPQLTTTVAFKSLTFERPVAMLSDGTDRLYVVEQHTGRIWSFPNQKNTSEKKLFFKLSKPFNTGNEEGLLGLAFHPRYKENGQFYIYYSAKDGGGRRSVLSKFLRSKNDPLAADLQSEERIWVSDRDPYPNHNGGTISFGRDGYLYIALGDSGSADDPLQTGQDPSDWFASILRIDVDHRSEGKTYGIPKDNPALRDHTRFAKWAPEVFAIGLRNVWKFSFDGDTLWAPDVGQNNWEEVNIVENGGNYGWSVREGAHDFPRKQKVPVNKDDLIEPLFDYPHSPQDGRTDIGQSVTGGFVYRGSRLKDLQGVYVFGDFVSGRVWGLRTKDKKLQEAGVVLEPNALNIASFAEDHVKELYILAFDGKIYEFGRRP